MSKYIEFTREKAENYDRNVAREMPKYEEMLDIAISFLPFPKNQRLKVLEYGIGTGNFSIKLIEHYVNAQVDGVDVSPTMLTVAKNKFGRYSDQVKLIKDDIFLVEIASGYDVVLASLVIHNGDSEEKKRLFEKTFKALDGAGILCIIDFFKSESEHVQSLYTKQWKNFLKSNKLSDKEIEEYFNIVENIDMPEVMEREMEYLKGAGFRYLDCIWRYHNFGVIIASNE